MLLAWEKTSPMDVPKVKWDHIHDEQNDEQKQDSVRVMLARVLYTAIWAYRTSFPLFGDLGSLHSHLGV